MEFNAGDYDSVIIGAGHAGVEAALACAKIGCKTVIITMNLDAIANCPCNPSIGGTAKGHLVREIDALGGEMGKTADECFIQSRMLNKGKGPAVHSLRVQIDRNKYSVVMKHKLELQNNLEIKQGEVISVYKDESGLWKIKTRLGAIYTSKCVVITTGTYLNSKIHIGEASYYSGPDNMFSSKWLGSALINLGIRVKTFKTGTPARVLKSSINFSVLEEQKGDEKIIPFSYSNRSVGENKVSCYVAWTNKETKKVILENIHRSPMYNGRINGIGPRYCPSIEDKIVKFSEKEKHQIFVEPCGIDTEEMYLQGMSTSLPEEIQIKLYKTIKGFENVSIMRPAYAIEYLCIDSTQLKPTLEFKDLEGLYGAGQFNGSSGYEEAAAQGIIAGINAALKVKNKEELILDRANSYIGTLIDDLVSKETNEPYRMMTSRSEYRLVLRQDNADERLASFGYKVGLVSRETWDKIENNKEKKEKENKRIKETTISPSEELNNMLVSRGTSPITSGVKIAELLKRPQVNYNDLIRFDKLNPNIDEEIFKRVEIEIKYEGYVYKQKKQIEEMRRLEKKPLSKDINYSQILGLRLEAIEKLQRIRPVNMGQASRISGVSPADLSVLAIWLSKQKFKGE